MGQGLGGKEENWQNYLAWKQGKSLEDLTRYIQKRKDGDVYRFTLGRGKINNELKIGTAINQNSLIRKDLITLEGKMLEEGLLPPDEPIIAKAEEEKTGPATATPPAPSGLSTSVRSRLNELEEENAYLREELTKKNETLKRYGLIDRFLTETMRVPR